MAKVHEQATPAGALGTYRVPLDKAGEGRASALVSELRENAGSVVSLTAFPVVGASDVGSHVVVNGVEYVVTARPTPGHSRSVTLEPITDANFLGFFRNFIAAAYRAGTSLAAGQFYYSTTYGDFEEYITNPSPGWSGYSPFETGEPWASVVIGSDTINLDPATHAIPVHGRAAAEPRASAVGQVFADLDAHEMLVVSAFTAEDAAFENFEFEVYHAPGVGGLSEALVSTVLGDPNAANVRTDPRSQRCAVPVPQARRERVRHVGGVRAGQ